MHHPEAAADQRLVVSSDEGDHLVVPVRGRHPQEATQFNQRLTTGHLDGFEAVSGPAWITVDHFSGSAGLQHHDADMVGDDVMELASDPSTFFTGREGGCGVALVSESDGLLREM